MVGFCHGGNMLGNHDDDGEDVDDALHAPPPGCKPSPGYSKRRDCT